MSASPRATARPPPLTPEDHLRKAMEAKTADARARAARRGLAFRGPIDRTTQAMLLRQLSLSLFELGRFARAREVALQAAGLDVLPDVLHQDAARAALAEGDVEGALSYLRLAARRAPASRRPFHYWTLGSTLFLEGRYDESIAALERAIRWGTGDKPLYRAHQALVRLAAGQKVPALQPIIDELASAPCGQGYGRFVLGHLAYAAGEWRAARRYLEAFVERTSSGRPSVALALAAELHMARETLGRMTSA